MALQFCDVEEHTETSAAIVPDQPAEARQVA